MPDTPRKRDAKRPHHLGPGKESTNHILLKNMKTLEDLKNYLIEEADYELIQVNNMTREELFDAYLTWNGIIGYTQDIMEAYKAAFLSPR